MLMASVLDTSFLIALAKLDRLDLLWHLTPPRLSSQGVEEELQVGRRKGYPQAERILEQLRQLAVKIRRVEAPSVDEEVLRLGQAEGAAVFSHDAELRRRAQARGLLAFGPEDFFFLLLCREVLDLQAYQQLIQALYAEGLIGRDRMAQYLRLNVERGDGDAEDDRTEDDAGELHRT